MNLKDCFEIIPRRRMSAIYAFLAVLALAGLYAMAHSITCSAVTELRFEQPVAAETGGDTAGDWDEIVESRVRAIKRFVVIKDAALRIGLIAEDSPTPAVHEAVRKLRASISAERMGNTNTVRITVRCARPEQAVETAGAVADAYVAQCEIEKKAESEKTSKPIQDDLARGRSGLQEAEARLKAMAVGGNNSARLEGVRKAVQHREQRLRTLLQEYTAEYPAVVEVKAQIVKLKSQLEKLADSELAYTRAQNEVAGHQKRIAALVERLGIAAVRGANRIPEVSVTDPAVLPEIPGGTGRGTIMLLGALLGLCAAVGAVFIPEVLRAVPESAEKSVKIEELKVSLERQGIELNRYRKIAQEKESLETVRASLERQLEVQAGEVEQLQKIAREKDELENTRIALEGKLREQGIEIDRLLRIAQEKEDLEKALGDIQKKLEDREQDFAADRVLARERAEQERTDLEKAGAELRRKIHGLEAEIERYRALAGEKEELQKARAELEKKLDAQAREVARLEKIEREKEELEKTGAGLAQKLAKEERDELHRRITQDRKAADRIRGALETKLEDQTVELRQYGTLTEEKDALQRELVTYKETFQESRADLEKELAKQEREMNQLREVAQEKEHVDAARSSLEKTVKEQAMELARERKEAEERDELHCRNGIVLERSRALLEKKLEERRVELERYQEIAREKEKLETICARLEQDVAIREQEVEHYRKITQEQRKIERIKEEAQRCRQLTRVFDDFTKQ